MGDSVTRPVTLLFSDIEGSTRLLKQLRGRYGDVVSVHRRLLRDAFTARGGEEVDTQGDSFFFVFETPQDAILAAIEATRALAEHPWPEDVDLRVRIGIHTGGTSVAGQHHHGLAVHRAARLCAAAHGGQILISATTHSLIRDEEEEPPGVQFLDLGEYRFQGFDRPDRVHQIVVEDLKSAFPPLRIAAAGRSDENGRQRALLTEAGETAIVAEAEARSLDHHYLATEHFLLAILRAEDTVAGRVLKSLGVSYPDVRTFVQQLFNPSTSERPPARLPLTPRTEKALEHALREALSFGTNISGEHILLGIARDSTCMGVKILSEFGVDEERLRREIIASLTASTN